MIQIINGSKRYFDEEIKKYNYKIIDFSEGVNAYLEQQKNIVGLFDEGKLKNHLGELMESKDQILIKGDYYSYQLLNTAGLNQIAHIIKIWLDAADKKETIFAFHNPTKRVLKSLNTLKNTISIYEYDQSFPNLSNDQQKDIYNEFDSKILGQEQVKKSIFASLAQFNKENDHKVKVVMLYGFAGVGKTETVKYLAEKNNGILTRVQMSMMQNEKAFDYFYGKDHIENSLSFDLKYRDSRFILFDEFDKVHSQLYNAFYQMFDESKFEDDIYNIDLSDSVIFLTANFMSLSEIEQNIGSPLYSRIDAFVKYNQLSQTSLIEFANAEIDEKLNALSDSNRKLLDELKLKIRILRDDNLPNNPRAIRKYINQKINEELVQKTFEE